MPDIDPLVPQQSNPAYPPIPVQDAVRALMGGVGNVASHIASIPQRAFQASENLRMGGDYDPAPVVQGVSMLMGGGIPMVERGAAGIFGGKLATGAKPGLTLKEVDKDLPGYFSRGEHVTDHIFGIHDSEGTHLGDLLATVRGGKHLHVDDVFSHLPTMSGTGPTVFGGYPNTLGTGNMRSLIAALRQEFPGLETISGTRVSGGRRKAGHITDAVINLPGARQPE